MTILKEKINLIGNARLSGCRLFFMAFVIYFLPMFLAETTFYGIVGGHILRLVSYLALPVLFFKVYIVDNWSSKQLLTISVVLLFTLIVSRTALNSDILFITPFVIGAKNVSFRDIMKWYLLLNTMFLLSVMIIALLGIIPNLIYRSTFRATRYSVGMIYPSCISAHFLYMALAYCYLRFGKLNLLDYVGIFIIDCIVMKLTNTRLDFLAVLLLIPIMIITQRAYKGFKCSKVLSSFWWMATPVFSTITIFSSYFYNSASHFWNKLDSLSSGRIILGYRAFQKYGVRLFGQSIAEHSFAGTDGHKLANLIGVPTGKYFYIDSSYIRMVVLWGILFSLLILICLTVVALKSTINRTYILSAIILISSLNSMFEPHVIQIIYNPFLLSLFALQDIDKGKDKK